VKHFLIIFDRSESRVLSLEAFEDPREAIRERFLAERRHRGNHDIEIVVLGAQSKAALKATHARYFEDFKQLARQAAQRMQISQARTAAC